MIAGGISEPTISLLEKNLDIRLRKHQLITSNIANIDTPNYKPFNIMVEEAFNKLENQSTAMKLMSSNQRHLPGKTNWVETAEVTQEDAVDIDAAMSDLAKNTMIYNATAQILSKKLNMLKQSVNGGSR